MSLAIRVAVVGFTPFTRSSLESFFKLAPRHRPVYRVVDLLRECDVIVANADDAERMAELTQRGKLARTVSIGEVAPPGVAAHLPRPLNMMQLLGTLDGLVPRLQAVSPSVQRVMDDFATITRNLDGSHDPRSEAASAAAPTAGDTDAGDTLALPLQSPPLHALDHILVVDPDDEALRFMVLHLERFGFQVSLARSGSEALRHLARRHHAFVFLDAEAADIDGYLLCQAVKRQASFRNAPPPTVVMMVRACDVLTAARSGLAGSDCCVGKPLNEQDLLRLVGEREVRDHAYAETLNGVRSVF